ncbi:MAG: Flp pilus assembly protein CpaB [Chloroflexi bacterium 13_1_40CM_4_68_4]|nr:MAG: Flp pilus assembly protein CpaB [Chloroflexi bacterium 13_1_40CM_4_68_4]
MRFRSWFFLILGLVLAGLTGIALNGVAQQNAARAAVTPVVETISVLVAKTDIAARTVIIADLLETRTYPKEILPDGAIGKAAEAVGQTTLAPIPKGAPVLRGQLVSAGGRTGASLTVDPGKVLVTFPTTDPLTAAGFVQAGDHVDILATVVSGAGENPKRTQTTVQDLEVLQVLGPTSAQPQRQTALAFMVDHQTALVLKYLRDSQATIDVALRSRDEMQDVTTTSVDVNYLIERFGIRR